MIIFEVNGVVTPLDDKTNITYSFNVDSYDKIIINYSYTPKICEDTDKAREILKECLIKYGEAMPNDIDELLPVKNLLTISVDNNDKYLGAAHRQCNDATYFIGKNQSSPGFEATKIQQGELKITLNAHSISCDVSYKITIEGVEKI